MMGPEHHRFHHSIKTEEAKNYCSVTAICDHLFGTFLYRPGETLEETGTKGPNRFPESNRFLPVISIHSHVDLLQYENTTVVFNGTVIENQLNSPFRYVLTQSFHTVITDTDY